MKRPEGTRVKNATVARNGIRERYPSRERALSRPFVGRLLTHAHSPAATPAANINPRGARMRAATLERGKTASGSETRACLICARLPTVPRPGGGACN